MKSRPDLAQGPHSYVLDTLCTCLLRVSVPVAPKQRVLRYGDMEYVMLHLIFIYLMPGEGQPAAYAASDL